ncbi:MAG: phospholipase D-like domain-containing protein [Myxococcota bacterium]
MIQALSPRLLALAPLLALLGAACAAPPPAVLPSVEARPPSPFPAREVVFTRPHDEGTGNHIRKLQELLSQAAPGSEVRVAVFLFDHEDLIEAFAAARRRGVRIHAIASEISWWHEGRLRSALEARGEEPRVFVFPGGMGKKNHNKFAVFSELHRGGERVRDVVFLSSGNFTRASLRKHQNTLVLVDGELYRAYQAYWADLVEAGLQRRRQPDYYRSAAGDDASTRVYFFPREEGGDTMTEILGRVSAEGDERPASIRVAMARWRRGRMEIAQRLCELHAAGTDVQVVTRSASRLADTGVDPEVLRKLRGCGVRLMELPKNRVNLHSKYVLVDAPYERHGETERRRVVWTGSPNFTTAALRRNDEALLEIEDPHLYERYRANFDELVQEWQALD